jgi:hypothetical protein
MPSRLLLDQESGELTAPAEDPFLARMMLELLLGTVASGVGAVGGALAGFTVADTVSCGIDDCLTGIAITGAGVITGIALLAPVGVYFAGRWVEGRGLFLATLGGAVVVGGLTALTVAALSEPVGGAAVVAMVVSPLVGAILGYEVSHHLRRRSGEGRRVAADGVQLLPTVGVTRSGAGVLGLAGRF